MKRKFGNIKPNMNYKLFFKWARNVDEFENDCVEADKLLNDLSIFSLVLLVLL